MSKYSIQLKESDKLIGTYRLDEEMFMTIKKQLEPFRSLAVQPKPIKCIETGVIFKNARCAARWLYENAITMSTSADSAIKSACKGKRKYAYGYHWEYAENK